MVIRYVFILRTYPLIISKIKGDCLIERTTSVLFRFPNADAGKFSTTYMLIVNLIKQIVHFW